MKQKRGSGKQHVKTGKIGMKKVAKDRSSVKRFKPDEKIHWCGLCPGFRNHTEDNHKEI